ncbi:MFS transporter [Thalassobaculum sp.]|uniref:MFS transporter n=1 Tax=Thalassobaculum sp. TaxID=2022740 RepID=UPI0032EFD5B0
MISGQTWLSARPQQTTVMLAAMIVLAVLSQFFRSSNGVIAPEIMSELQFDAQAIGLSSGAFFVIFAVLQLPIGVLFDSYGPRRVVSGMLVFAVLGSVLFAVAHSLGLLVAGRFLIGLGFAGGMVGSLVVLSRWLDPTDFTRAMTILFASANLGSLLATSPLSASTELLGWRATFVSLSVITAVVAFGFWWVVRDEPEGRRDRRARPDSLAASIRGVSEVFRVPGLMRILPLIALGYSSIITIIGLWGGPFLHDVHGVDGLERGNLLSVLAVAFVAGTLAYGPIQRRVGAFRPVVIGGAVGSAALLLVLAAVSHTSLSITLPLLVVTCFVGAFSVVLMGHGVALIPAELKGRGTTALNAVLMGGTALLQIGSGAVVEAVHGYVGSPSSGYAAFFAVLGALILVATAGYLATPEPKAAARERT